MTKGPVDDSGVRDNSADNGKALPEDVAEVRRSIEVAEGKARNWWDLCKCAESWKHLLDDDAAARRCLLKAEVATSGDSIDTADRAEFWKNLLDDDAEARRCLEMAERVGGVSDCRTDFAKSWKNTTQKATRWWKKCGELAPLRPSENYGASVARNAQTPPKKVETTNT